MKYFSYIVSRDYGFAPNPYHGFCTLADCKPNTRYSAEVGDIIFGISGADYTNGDKKLIFAMQVNEILTFNEYFLDPRFEQKKPNVSGTKKQQYGDNIYYKDSAGNYKQIDSHHSKNEGEQYIENITHDTKIDKVLISKNFVYYGKNAPNIPSHLISSDTPSESLKIIQNHKCNFSENFKKQLAEYWNSLNKGIHGEPNEWK